MIGEHLRKKIHKNIRKEDINYDVFFCLYNPNAIRRYISYCFKNKKKITIVDSCFSIAFYSEEFYVILHIYGLCNLNRRVHFSCLFSLQRKDTHIRVSFPIVF
ncbi:hypothetical protein CN618_18630 [Bacillus wiedmannii]|nr:hypothetical protein CN618_18630 [Bacillus wiedmannii]